jgi:hypothetical protein
MSNEKFTATPKQIPGKGWDVLCTVESEVTTMSRYLCAGRAPYTLQQAQIAADAARRDARRHGVNSLDFSYPNS